MQLSLSLDGDIAPQIPGRTPEQEVAFQQVLADIRAETQQLLKAAISISGEPFSTLTAVPTTLLRQARERVLGPTIKAQPRPTEEVGAETSAKPYRSWSLRRKYGNRCVRMMERIRKRSTLWFCEELQAHVLTNPEYFGVCPLPSEGGCTCQPEQRLMWARSEAAKQRECLLRQRDRNG